MKTLDLEQVIRDYIKSFYHKEYIHPLRVTKPDGYKVEMYIHQSPTVIYIEEDDDIKLLETIKLELRDRNFHLSSYRRLDKRYPFPCTPINTKCNDKRCSDREN